MENFAPSTGAETVGTETAAKLLESMLKRVEAPGEVPYPPGIVGETAEWIYWRMVKPYRPAAILGAIVFWSFLAARRVRYQNQGTSLAALVLLRSSLGKEVLQTIIPRMLGDVGVPGKHFTGRICSHSAGVEKLCTLYPHPVVYSADDECAEWFRGDDAYGARYFHREAWSKATEQLFPKGRTEAQGRPRLYTIPTPSYFTVKSLQPKALARVASSALIDDGTLARFYWIVADDGCRIRKSEDNLNRPTWLDNPDPDADPTGNHGPRILATARKLWNWLSVEDGKRFANMAEAEAQPIKPGPKPEEAEDATVAKGRLQVWRRAQVVGAAEEIREVFRVLMAWSDDKTDRDDADDYEQLFSKFCEKVKRTSLALAAARCAQNFTLDDSGRVVAVGPFALDMEETLWAVRWTLATDNAGVSWLRDNLADSRLARMCNAVKEIIRKAPKREIKHRDLMRKCKNLWERQGDADWVLDYLCDTVEEVEKADGKPTIYRLRRD